MQTVSIFGATGTIGDNVLDIIDQHRDRFAPKVLTANGNIEKLAALAQRWHPDLLVVSEAEGAKKLAALCPDFGGEILVGEAGLAEAAGYSVDLAVMSIVGFAALAPTVTLVAQGARIVLANKECLVAGGDLLMAAAGESGATLLPADSEHNAVFQLLQGQDGKAVQKIVLTASGGPFRNMPVADLANVTPAMAVAHPNWEMGAKISVDSATMMNKGLELIEAKHLFGLPADRFDVLVHPQSVVHGLVYFADGSVLAQKGAPDMRTPLAHCMGYPERLPLAMPPLDLARIGQLDFEAPDREKFPCLPLCEDAMHTGGLAPTVLNAANEVAVACFLDGQLRFTDIPVIVEQTLTQMPVDGQKIENLDSIIACDGTARRIALEKVKNRGN